MCSWLNLKQALSWSRTLKDAFVADTVPFVIALGNGTSMYFRSRTLLKGGGDEEGG